MWSDLITCVFNLRICETPRGTLHGVYCDFVSCVNNGSSVTVLADFFRPVPFPLKCNGCLAQMSQRCYSHVFIFRTQTGENLQDISMRVLLWPGLSPYHPHLRRMVRWQSRLLIFLIFFTASRYAIEVCTLHYYAKCFFRSQACSDILLCCEVSRGNGC